MEEENLENIDIDFQTKKLPKRTIILGIVSLVLLICAVFVVILTTGKRVKAPTPKAYFATAKAWFLPYTASPMQVGDAFPVYLVADFGTLDVVGFTIKITYSPNKLELRNGISDIIVNSGFPTEILKEVKATTGEIFLSYVNVSGVSSLLDLGNPWVRLNFVVKDLGTAVVTLDKSYTFHQLSAVTTSEDTLIDLKNESGGEPISVNYTLTGPIPTPTLAHTCNDLCTVRSECIGWCQNSLYYCISGKCLIPSPIPTLTNTPLPTVTSSPKPTATFTPRPTATLTPIPPTNTPTQNLCSCPAGVPPKDKGNANCDNVIDLRDLQIWRNERWGRTNTKTADFNCDGVVDISDFQIWSKNRWRR